MIPVFPLVPNGKVPAIQGGHGFKDASDDPKVLAAWREQYPDANWGMPTGAVSGYDVFDIDVPKPEEGKTDDGRKAFMELERIHGEVNTRVVMTPSGGMHLYFLARPDVEKAAKPLPGVDVKSDGGYVVIPPSSIDGESYRWLDGYDLSRGHVAPWPEWLLEIVRKKERAPTIPAPQPAAFDGGTAWGDKSIHLIAEELASVPAGGRDVKRNAICFRVGRFVAAGHVSYDDALSAMLMACERNGLLDDLGERELRKRCESGIADGMAAGPVGPAPKPKRRPQAVAMQEGEHHEQNGVYEPAVASEPPERELRTELGNARRIVRLHGADMRYSASRGWVIWDGKRWKPDDTGEADRRAQAAIVSMLDEAKTMGASEDAESLVKWAIKSQKAGVIEASLRLARTQTAVSVTPAAFDKEPYLLNVDNGTLDLRTGQLRPHRREDLITKVCPVKYEPSAFSPLWQETVEKFLPDPEIRSFVQRYLGSCLTGDPSDQAFAVFCGGGGNGKTTILETATRILGDYFVGTPFSTLTAKRDQSGSTADLASLAGARFVLAAEPPERITLNASTVKYLTGGDTITARLLYRDFFSFVPQFKLALMTNFRPNIEENSHAIWRRVHLVPFNVRIQDSERIEGFKERIWEEGREGAFRWLVEGCMEWQTERLSPPDAIRAANAEYRSEEDEFGSFLEEKTADISTAVTRASALVSAYNKWAKENGADGMSAKALAGKLRQRGLRNRKSEGVMVWVGIALRPDEKDEEGGMYR